MRTGGDIAKAIALGADAVMIGSPLACAGEAPGPRLPLGHGDLPPGAAPRHARQGAGQGHHRGDPHRSGTRERRHAEPVRRPAHQHGHLRLRDHPDLPEGRGHGGALADDARARSCRRSRTSAWAEPHEPAAGSGAAARGSCRHARTRRREWVRRAAQAWHREPSTGFDTVLVLDFGAQYGQLIARRVRELHVYSQLIPHDTPIADIVARQPQGHHPLRRPHERLRRRRARGSTRSSSSSASPSSASATACSTWRGSWAARWPAPAPPSSARPTLCVADQGLLLAGLDAEEQCWMSHRDCVTEAPPGFTCWRPAAPRRWPPWKTAARLLRRPVPSRGRAHAEGHGRAARLPLPRLRLRADWTPASIIEEQVRLHPRAGRPPPRPSSASPGGVDSSVAALLVHKAIGDQLTCVFVDHGMMRLERGRARGRDVRDVPSRSRWSTWTPRSAS